MLVNTRILMAPTTGVQRYLAELLAAWPGEPPQQLSPPAWAWRGISGHAWEQLVSLAWMERSRWVACIIAAVPDDGRP